MALCRRIKLTGIQYDRGEIMKNSKATVSNLTEQDIKELQNYLAAMNDLYEQEPKEIWDDFFKDMQDKAEIPLKYRDRVKIIKAPLEAEYINGKYQLLDKPRTVDAYIDIAREDWQNKLIATSQKYNDVINKAIIYAEQQHLSAPPKIRDIVKACIRAYNETSQQKFAPIICSSGLQLLAKTDTAKVKKRKLTDNDVMIYATDDIEIAISDFMKNGLTQKSVAAQMLFHIMLIEFTNFKSKAFDLSLRRYMEYRGLKDTKTARENFERDLDLWYRSSITFKENKIKKKPRLYKAMRILQANPALERGAARIVFTDEFYKYLLSVADQIQQFPLPILRLSAQSDKYTYLIGSYLSYLERVQAGNPNQYHIKVITVLEQCEFLTLEETGRHPERIIKPFIDALNRLVEIGYLTRYEFIDAKGKKADRSRLNEYNYDYFITLYLDYATTTPSQSHLIEHKDQQREKAKAYKEKKKKKAI
jgi:uncharacterized ubiquitin-like protein YukD